MVVSVAKSARVGVGILIGEAVASWIGAHGVDCTAGADIGKRGAAVGVDNNTDTDGVAGLAGPESGGAPVVETSQRELERLQEWTAEFGEEAGDNVAVRVEAVQEGESEWAGESGDREGRLDCTVSNLDWEAVTDLVMCTGGVGKRGAFLLYSSWGINCPFSSSSLK